MQGARARGELWLRSNLFGDRIQRRGRGGDQPGADVHVADGGADVGVAEQHLNHAQIGTGFQAVSRKGVPQRVRRDALGDPAVGQGDA